MVPAMKRAIKLFMAGVAVLFLALIVAAPMAAHAAEPSKCGAWATGTRSDGMLWTGAQSRMWVDSTGVWRQCQPWIKDGEDPTTPEPPPELYCAARDTFEVWEVDGLQCSSIPPGFSTSTTMMLPRTKAGRVALIRAEWGPTRGLLVMRCTPRPHGTAEWRVEGSTCAYRE